MTRSTKFFALLVLCMFGTLVWSGCTINSDKDKNGNDKVDIKTPFGNLKVDEGIDPRDTGLPLYAGAKPVQKANNDSDSANVNISSSYFGVKVVAGEFTTPDAPAKVRDFYEKALGTYGKVLVCKGSYNENVTVNKGGDDADKPVNCSDVHGNNNDDLEMKVGTENHQHIVSVKPEGSGSRFALIYVNVRGKESGS